jgi:hypothetical protein
MQVAREEFGPRPALQKYEWFIEQSRAIDKMDQDVRLFESRRDAVAKKYQGYGEDMAKWPPHVQVQYNSESERANDDLVAVVSQRNNLAKEYNAAASKFNWKPFETRSDTPPQSVKEYVVK